MPVQIGQKKESDFSDPLGLLSDCHRRIEHFLDVLTRVCGRARGRSLEPEERVALEKALVYFRNSAPKHTADEEDSLFPRLRAAAAASSALLCLAALEDEHEVASRDHQLVDSIALEWLAQGEISAEQRMQLDHALAGLSEMYARHIAVEDRELFPLAARALDAEQLAAIGREMAGRREVKA